ncbi:MAG: endo-1,4-beta-xylanase [Lachnospiraceae bacterium]|nr:endo-1,4-beta-xylanase [Lachnospiraceae bacterium]
MKKKTIIVLVCIFALLLTGCGIEKVKLPAQKDVTSKNIKDVFSEHGMKVGTCISANVINDKKMSALVLEQFNSVTMENAMKPDYILNQKRSQAEGKLVVEFNQEAISVLSWAKDNGLSVRGHTLIWYSQTPEWIFHEGFDTKSAYVGRDEMLLRMESLISGVFKGLDRLGYIDLFYAYDVINEAWMEDGTIRKNHWTETIGDDYLWYAFYYADKYAPESIDLYYNDYNEQYKADTLSAFVNTLKGDDDRFMIDGIGLQAHLFTSDDIVGYLEAVDSLSETGLKLEVTELDIGLGKYQSPLSATDANLRTQGKFYYELINDLFERADSGKVNMDSVTFWGFSDGISWRREYSPQLYDSDLDPKYSLYGVLQIKEYSGY